MKRILLQLDTEEHPSPFDAIVAHDADVDVLLSHGNVKREDARALAQAAFFTRGPDDLKNTAIWVGGKHVAAGEKVFAEVQKAFFGPFQVSVMIDSNGCNTTAATAIARSPRARPRRQARGRARPRVASGCARRSCCRTRAARSSSPLCRPTFRRRPPLPPPPRPGRRPRSSGSIPASPRTAPSSRRRSTARGRPGRGTGRHRGPARRTSGRSTRASSCSPTTTPPSRWASRAPRRRTTSRTTTASWCSARWPSAGRR